MPFIEGGLGSPLLHAGVPTDGTSEVQTITVTGSPTGGTFKLRFQGVITSALVYNISGANMQTALRALASIGAGGCSVAGNGPYVVTFTGDLANLELAAIVLHSNALAGGTAPSVSIVRTTPGVTATERGAATGAQLTDTTNGTLYQNGGTPNSPEWGLVGDEAADGPGLKSTTVTLTNAQIKSLPSESPVTLVGAVNGAIIRPKHVVCVFNSTVAYTNVTTEEWKLGFPDGAGTVNFTACASNYDLTLGANILTDQMSQATSADTPLADVSGALALYITNSFSGTIATVTKSGTAAAGTGSYNIALASASAYHADDSAATPGSGVGATFHVARAGGVYTVTFADAPSRGHGFAADEIIVIHGSLLGGINTTNDLTITVATVATLTEDFTGGDPANNLKITVFYVEVAV